MITRNHMPVLAIAGMLGGAGCAPDVPAIVVGTVEFSAPPGSLAPSLGVGGEGEVVLSWLEPAGERRYALRVAVRQDGSWSEPRTVTVSDALFVNWADVPSVQPLADGSWLAHWLQKTGPGTYAYHVRMAVSTDRARTWSPPFRPHGDSSETEHGFVSLVPGERGTHALWLDGRLTADSGPMTLRYTTVVGAAAEPDMLVDERVCDCCQTAMAPTARGLIVAYRDRAEGEIRDVVVRRLEDGRWTDAAKVSDDGWHYPGCPVNGPAIAARGDTVVVVWFTAADGAARVYAAVSADGGATFGPRIQVDDGRPTGRVDALWWGERVLVSWLEESDEAGEVRVRELDGHGAMTASTLVAATWTSRAAGFPRMARDGDAVVVAWTDPQEGGGVRAVTLARAR